MRDLLKTTLLTLLLAAPAGTVQSQEQAPAAEDQSEGGSDAGGRSMGTVVGESAGEVQVGDPYLRESYGDWDLRCVKSEDGADPCQLYQLLRDGEGNSVAEFNIFPLPEGGQAAAGANVITPLETLLTANLRLAVDGGQAKVYPYAFCSRIGCFARIGLTGDEVAQFRKGAAATVTIVPAASPDQVVELSLSLSGFTDGYEALGSTAEAAE